MKYSYNWLQSHIEQKLPDPDSLKETIIFHAFEVEDVEVKNGDSIFDIKVLPDRAGDCLSHYGMAREIAGLLGLTLKTKDDMTLPGVDLLLPVEVKSELCRRYIAVRVDGITVGSSPAWLVERLESVGQRSINNIVDATNFILLDHGQPTHAYDAAKIDGGIIVRDAHDSEKIVTLSDEEKTLTPGMLVISDYLGVLGVAGVKGGKNAEIATDTTSIVLEIASFDPASVRRTARSLALHTDASKRFENDLSPETAGTAALALVALIRDIAGGEVTGVKDIYPNPMQPRTLMFTGDEISRILGKVSADAIAEIFDYYGYTYSVSEKMFTLEIPYWRRDITGPHDIAEEIGRWTRYALIDAKPLPEHFKVEVNPIMQNITAARAWLVHDGYREVMTYTFCKKGAVEVARGPQGKSSLRTNLSDGLKESYDLNRLNAPLLGLSDVKLFEIGTVFSADTEEIHIATADKNGITEYVLTDYIAQMKIVVDTATLEITNDAHPFNVWSSYPFITRDIAVWVQTDEAKLQHIIESFAGDHCVVPATMFDRFEKERKVSVAYRLVFQSFEKTLTDAEVETWMHSLRTSVETDPSFQLR